jgi:hypothetical protein
MGQMDTLVMNGIKVYTIGLGPMVDGSLLGWMADYTGGRYYLAQTAEELVGIYLNISDQFYDYTAGTECTLFAELDPDIEFVEGSSSIADDFTSQWNDGHWRLVWSVGALRIGSNWTVTFNVTSPDGSGKLKLFQAGSTIEYADWRGENRSAGLPDVYLTVLRGLPPPLPPPPTPPPPAAMAPVPPPPSVPVVAPTVNVAPVITATPNITPVTIGQAGSVPVEYMLAGLAALGIADRINLKKKIIEKQRVSVGA